MKIRTTDKPWNKRRFLRNIAAALAFGVFVPVQVSAEEVAAAVEPADETLVEAQTNEFTSSYLELVDSFTTAERIPSSRFDTPANVIVITADEIAANHYKSVSEAVRHANGVYTWNLNGSSKIIVLVDGHRASHTPIIETVERIEILKGGASALYGSEAVGGVINIITKKGQFNETTFDFDMGSWHQRRYALTNQGDIGKFSWFLAGSIEKAHPFKYSGSYSGNYSDEVTDANNDAFSIRLDKRFDDANSLTLDFMHASNKYNNYGQYQPLKDHSPDFYDLYNSVSLVYNFKEDTNAPGFIRYFNDYKTDYSYNDFDGNERLQGIDYQNGWELDDKNTLIAGFEWHRTDWQHYYIDYDKKKVTNTAYYIQDTMRIDDRWTFIPGIRLDHSSAFGNQWSPKAAVNYRAGDSTKIYASYGRAYRAPAPIQLYSYGGIQGTGSFEFADMEVYGITRYINRGHSNLDPESGNTATIGVEHNFDDKTNLNASVFYSNVNHSIDLIESDPNKYINLNDYNFYQDIYYDWVNASSEKHRGIDIAFRQELNEHWDYNVGYVHTHSEREQNQGNTLFHFVVPQNSYRLGVRYSNRDIKASLLGIMGTGMDENFFDSSNYVVLDINTSYDVTDWATVYLKLANLTDENYSYNGKNFRSPGRSILVGAQFKF